MTGISRAPILNDEAYKAIKTIAFDGTAGNGAVGTVALFTITGDVLVRVTGVCTESLVSAGGGSISVGGSGSLTTILNTTVATTIANGDVFITGSGPAQMGALGGNFIVHGANIIANITTGDVTDGTITFYCLWRPLSADGNVS